WVQSPAIFTQRTVPPAMAGWIFPASSVYWLATTESGQVIDQEQAMPQTSIEAFKVARQQLLDLRADYDRVYAEFQWPELDRFNWALDWFVAYAAGREQPALWLVDADGSEEKYSFEQMRQRSNQVANYLRARG